MPATDSSSTKIPGRWYQRLLAFIWYDLIVLLYASIGPVFKEIFTSPPKPDINGMDKKTGQMVIITGGPRGLALGLIKRLAQLDYNIIMGVRNVEDSQKRLSAFAESNKELSFSKIKMLPMDLMSLDSVRKFAENVLQETSRIDLLLCNAANMREPYVLSVDGFESQFQVNYLSAFLLTHLLLERLKHTAELKGLPCHVIFTSTTWYKHGTFFPNELGKPIVYSRSKFYYQSKLYPVMSMIHLQRLLDDEGAQVKCSAVHPGIIPTDLWYSGGGYIIGLFGNTFTRLFRVWKNHNREWCGYNPVANAVSGIFKQRWALYGERFFDSYLPSVENAADAILWSMPMSPYMDKWGAGLQFLFDSMRSIELLKYVYLYEKSLKLDGLPKTE